MMRVLAENADQIFVSGGDIISKRLLALRSIRVMRVDAAMCLH
jgi:hypothetical protein